MSFLYIIANYIWLFCICVDCDVKTFLGSPLWKETSQSDSSKHKDRLRCGWRLEPQLKGDVLGISAINTMQRAVDGEINGLKSQDLRPLRMLLRFPSKRHSY